MVKQKYNPFKAHKAKGKTQAKKQNNLINIEEDVKVFNFFSLLIMVCSVQIGRDICSNYNISNLIYMQPLRSLKQETYN